MPKYIQKNQINRLIERNDGLNNQINEIEGDKMILIQEQYSLQRRIHSYPLFIQIKKLTV